MTQPILRCSDIVFGYSVERKILHGLSFALFPGEVVGLIGPNGGGKSTLLKVLAGFFPPDSGTVELAGKPLASYSGRERARKLACLPQDFQMNFPFTVREVVAMGRTPHLGRFHIPGKNDRLCIDSALAEMELAPLANRRFSALSGGEKRRAMLASSLAQNAEVLLLDEPTSALDMGHAARLMRHIRKLGAARNIAALIVSHDIELVGRYADRVIVFRDGGILAAGAPEEVITAENIAAAYRFDVSVMRGSFGESLLSYR